MIKPARAEAWVHETNRNIFLRTTMDSRVDQQGPSASPIASDFCGVPTKRWRLSGCLNDLPKGVGYCQPGEHDYKEG